MVLDEHKHNFDIHINHIEHEDVCGDSLREDSAGICESDE